MLKHVRRILEHTITNLARVKLMKDKEGHKKTFRDFYIEEYGFQRFELMEESEY